VCGVVISRDIELPYGFFECATDEFPGLCSRGRRVAPYAYLTEYPMDEPLSTRVACLYPAACLDDSLLLVLGVSR